MKEPRGFQGLPACHVIKMYNLHPSDSSSFKQTSGRRLLWNSPLRELFSCIDRAAHSGSWTLLFVDMKSLLYKNYIIDNQSWCESHSTLGRPGSCFWQSIPMGETAFVSNSWCLLKHDNQTFGGGWWLQHRDCISKSTFVYRCMTDKTLDSLELSWCGHDWVIWCEVQRGLNKRYEISATPLFDPVLICPHAGTLSVLERSKDGTCV